MQTEVSPSICRVYVKIFTLVHVFTVAMRLRVYRNMLVCCRTTPSARTIERV